MLAVLPDSFPFKPLPLPIKFSSYTPSEVILHPSKLHNQAMTTQCLRGCRHRDVMQSFHTPSNLYHVHQIKELLPVFTTGQHFLHSCRHFFGLHLQNPIHQQSHNPPLTLMVQQVAEVTHILIHLFQHEYKHLTICPFHIHAGKLKSSEPCITSSLHNTPTCYFPLPLKLFHSSIFSFPSLNTGVLFSAIQPPGTASSASKPTCLH